MKSGDVRVVGACDLKASGLRGGCAAKETAGTFPLPPPSNRRIPRGEDGMLVYAVIAFAIAAVGGLILAASVLRGQLAPWALSLVHAAQIGRASCRERVCQYV